MTRRALHAAAFLLLVSAVPLAAQDKPVPPPTDMRPETTTPVRKKLPGLNLPQYVITGADEIGFPPSAKQEAELLRPADFAERAGRGDREARFADVAMLRRPLDLAPLDSLRRRLKVLAGYGRFATPRVEVWYGDRFVLGDIAAHVGYEQTDGHVARADRSRFALDLTGGTWLPAYAHPLFARSRLEGSLAFAREEYGLYADKLAAPAPVIDLRRTLTTGRWGALLASRGNRIVEHEVALGLEHTVLDEQAARRDSADLGGFRREEHVLALDARAGLALLDHPLDLGMDLRLGMGTTTTGNPNRPFFSHVFAESRHAFGRATELEGGVHLWLMQGSQAPLSARVYPRLTLTHRLDTEASVFAAWVPAVERMTLAEMLAEHPYLDATAELRHTDIPVRVRLGGAWDDRRTLSARAWIEYTWAAAWLREEPAGEPLAQTFRAAYAGGTSITALHVDGEYRVPGAGRVQGRLALRSARVADADAALAQVPGVELAAMYVHPFAFGLELGVRLGLEAARSDRLGDLPNIFLVGLDATWAITPEFGVFARVENLLDQRTERWRGYSQRPLFVMGGVTLQL